MNKIIQRTLITGFLLLSAAFAARAQKAPRPQALAISAEIMSAHAPRQSDASPSIEECATLHRDIRSRVSCISR